MTLGLTLKKTVQLSAQSRQVRSYPKSVLRVM